MSKPRYILQPLALRLSWSTLLFFVLLLIYESNGDFLYTNDATASTYLPLSVLRDGDLVFTPSEAPFMFLWELHLPQGTMPFAFRSWTGNVLGIPLWELYARGDLRVHKSHYYLVPTQHHNDHGEEVWASTFGPVPGLTALPVTVVASALNCDFSNNYLIWHLAKFTAALLCAASAALLFVTARLWLSPRPALLLAIAYGLGTGVWSLGSQALWQQTANSFFLAVGFYLWLRALGDVQRVRQQTNLPSSVKYSAAGAALAFGSAVACRPVSLAPALVAGISLLIAHRRAGVLYGAMLLPPLLAFCAYNAHYLDSPFFLGQIVVSHSIAQSKTGSAALWQTPLWIGAAGLLFSPSRGLFVFSPFLLCTFVGLAYLRNEKWRPLRPLPWAILPVMLAQFKWFDWWGGWSYGPRPLLDMMFPSCLLLIPAWPWLRASHARLAGFGVLLAWSVLVQFIGAFAYDGTGWNGRLNYYELQWPGQKTSMRVSDEAAAQRLMSQQGARVVREDRFDVDESQYRWRLWSLTDNEIAYYLTHFRTSLAVKRAQLHDLAQ